MMNAGRRPVPEGAGKLIRARLGPLFRVSSRPARCAMLVFRRIQEELDWSELDAAPAGSFQSLGG
jgi:hypothetical protein